QLHIHQSLLFRGVRRIDSDLLVNALGESRSERVGAMTNSSPSGSVMTSWRCELATGDRCTVTGAISLAGSSRRPSVREASGCKPWVPRDGGVHHRRRSPIGHPRTWFVTPSAPRLRSRVGRGSTATRLSRGAIAAAACSLLAA